MNDELRKKLLEDIEKTGFASEMRAVQAFLGAGWVTPGPSAFYDRDGGVTREIDIVSHAYRYIKADGARPAIRCFYQVVAEVKKARAPWIVIRSREAWSWEVTDAWQNLISHACLPDEPTDFYRVISEHSLRQTLGWSGHGMHEAFKSPDDGSKWYSAFVSACKAAEDQLTANAEDEEGEDADAQEVRGSRESYLFFVKPVVVLDGTLTSATLMDGEIVLQEISAANFDFTFRTPNYDRQSYSVDVVTLAYLEEYLALSERRLDGIFNALRDSFDKASS